MPPEQPLNISLEQAHLIRQEIVQPTVQAVEDQLKSVTHAMQDENSRCMGRIDGLERRMGDIERWFPMVGKVCAGIAAGIGFLVSVLIPLFKNKIASFFQGRH